MDLFVALVQLISIVTSFDNIIFERHYLTSTDAAAGTKRRTRPDLEPVLDLRYRRIWRRLISSNRTTTDTDPATLLSEEEDGSRTRMDALSDEERDVGTSASSADAL